LSEKQKFHLSWFHTFITDDWTQPRLAGDNPWTGDFYVELARSLERACFDYLLFEDTVMISTAYAGSTELALKAAATAPKHDPVPLVAMLGAHTRRLGLMATMSTSFYPPYLLARLASTIDHLSSGRFGWNVVTSAEDLAAQNFGMDEIAEHDLRYEMADEYVTLVKQLWDSWEPDAVVENIAENRYVDFAKVHEINFKGKYYSSRGPLNTVRPPQGHPVICQAGASPRGKDFAAKHADTVLSQVSGIPGMKAVRDDLRARAVAQGRDPDELKVLFLIAPIIASSEAEARDKRERWMNTDANVGKILEFMSSITEIDFSQYPLDEPLPELSTNGEQGMLNYFRTRGHTLREMAVNLQDTEQYLGTPQQVADNMEQIIDEVGGDGFLISCPKPLIDRAYVTDVLDGLVPELQRRGRVRTEYRHAHLRDNLREF
jgi:long-chain alkane monooxygenase